MITALVIFIITYLFIRLRQIPRLHIDRPACALVGAVLMIIAMLAGEAKPACAAEAIAAEKAKQLSSVTITPSVTRSVPRTFSIVLVCDTDEARTQGLQGFRHLRSDQAALFVFEEPEVVTFWMGEVTYPIDIVFVGFNKKVVRVYPDCRPGSQDTFPSGEKAVWVIETAAGSGIKAGDGVNFNGFGVQGAGFSKKP